MAAQPPPPGARTAAAAAVAPTAAQLVVAEKAGQAAVLASDAVLSAFVVFARRRDAGLEPWLAALLADEAPHRSVVDTRALAQDEVARERAFIAKARARLERDLPEAFARPVEDRRDAVLRVLDRERRYQGQREQAMADRATARVRMMDTQDESPAGAWWVLGERSHHTPGCTYMAKRGWWPWSVLGLVHPLIHAGCGCDLLTADEARARGLLRGDPPPTADVDGRGAAVAELVAGLEEH